MLSACPNSADEDAGRERRLESRNFLTTMTEEKLPMRVWRSIEGRPQAKILRSGHCLSISTGRGRGKALLPSP